MSGKSVGVLGEEYLENGLVISCEHASNRVRPWLEPDDIPARWLTDHWGWDVGAFELARRLGRRLNAPVVYSRFSRLLCDVNRKPGVEKVVRDSILGERIEANTALTDRERSERISNIFKPYHQKLSNLLERAKKANADTWFLSIHSFTPKKGGQLRPMEMGVLYDDYDNFAKQMARRIEREGFDVALNEPYSGLEDSIYSVARHGSAQRVPYLELEVRNDLIDYRKGWERVANRLGDVIEKLDPVRWTGRGGG